MMKRLKTLKQEFQDYCDRSSIAGLQHVTDKSRSRMYQLCWLVIIVLAFILSGIMVWSAVVGN